jgi:hypothetical protein
MIWNPDTMTLQGLVPEPKSKYDTLMLVGTDSNKVSVSMTFKVYYLSKPYLNKAISNFKIRT